MFNSVQKLGKTFSLTLLFAPVVSSVAVAQGEDYDNFPTGDHEGGGVRGALTSCATNANYPVPLVPEAATTLTTSPSPTLFFDVPDVVQASSLEVVLLDGDNNVVYQNELETGSQPGIIGFNLSNEGNYSALKVNNSYHWYLIQECDNSAEPNIIAKGSLQRVELDGELAKEISNASGLEKVKLYRQADIWHEAIANLANFKCNSQAESVVTQEWIDEEFTNIPNLSNQSFQSYCLNKPDSELAMQ